MINFIRTFEYTKAVTRDCVKVGGGLGQGPITEMTHLRLNHPSVFAVRSFIPGTTLVFCPACMCLPARNGLVNEVEFLGLIPKMW